MDEKCSSSNIFAKSLFHRRNEAKKTATIKNERKQFSWLRKIPLFHVTVLERETHNHSVVTLPWCNQRKNDAQWNEKMQSNEFCRSFFIQHETSYVLMMDDTGAPAALPQQIVGWHRLVFSLGSESIFLGNSSRSLTKSRTKN